MGREATYFGKLAAGEVLFLPFYGVSTCAVSVLRIDNADSTGEVYAKVVSPKVWNYDTSVGKILGPSAYYGFPTVQQPGNTDWVWSLSTASAPVESYTGRALAASGVLVGSQLPTARLWNKSLMVPPTVSVKDTGNAPLTARENAGQPWSVALFVYRVATTGAGWLYLEANAAVTNYFGLLMNASGTISVFSSAGVPYTSTYALPLNTWTLVIVASNGTQISLFINGALTNGPTAYTHLTGLATTDTYLNRSGLGQHYTANAYSFTYQLLAWACNLMWQELQGDYYSGGVVRQGSTMAQGASFSVVFTNDAAPASGGGGIVVGLVGSTLPLQGIGAIVIVQGQYFYEIHTEESDV